jgi:hypothetical protein
MENVHSTMKPLFKCSLDIIGYGTDIIGYGTKEYHKYRKFTLRLLT